MKKECFQTYRQEGYAQEAEEICIGALSSWFLIFLHELLFLSQNSRFQTVAIVVRTWFKCKHKPANFKCSFDYEQTCYRWSCEIFFSWFFLKEKNKWRLNREHEWWIVESKEFERKRPFDRQGPREVARTKSRLRLARTNVSDPSDNRPAPSGSNSSPSLFTLSDSLSRRLSTRHIVDQKGPT